MANVNKKYDEEVKKKQLVIVTVAKKKLQRERVTPLAAMVSLKFQISLN